MGTDALLVEVADVAEAAAVYSEARRRGIDAVDIVPAARTVQFSGVPAGSVGLAGAFTGVYPSASPGGWQLIGRTDLTLRDVDRDDPATLSPGTRVRFVDVGR